MSSSVVFEKHMFSEKRGIALLGVENKNAMPKTGAFVQNAVLIDRDDRQIRTIQLKPITKMASYVVNIEVDGKRIYLVDFRGYRYEFNAITETAAYLDHYEKY